MSLPVAERGANAHLRYLWEASEFDFEAACRAEGRNHAIWVHCYRLHLDGGAMPDERERDRLVRVANRSTGGLNQLGERERYTRYEAQTTIEQVSRMRYGKFSKGLRPVLKIRRHWAADSRSRYATPPARRLLEEICRVAEACGRAEEIVISHRRMAELADLDPSQVAPLLHSLRAAKQVFRLGFTPCYGGRPRGTTRLSLKCPRPTQMVDEVEPPAYDHGSASWKWSTPLEKGTMSQSRYRWLTRPQPSAAAGMPYVCTPSPSTGVGTPTTPNSSRGSPLPGYDLDEKTTNAGHADTPSGLSV